MTQPKTSSPVIASLEGDIAWGLTLRDHIATQAMAGYLAGWRESGVGESTRHQMEIAREAYHQADAMLAAREEGGAS